MTLERDNLIWLRGRTLGRKRRSLSDALDDLIATARQSGQDAGAIRSVVGTIDIAADDPMLEKADSCLRGQFEASIGGSGLSGQGFAPERSSLRRAPRKARRRRG